MKYKALLFGLLSVFAVSCAVNELEEPADEFLYSPRYTVFHASVEGSSAPDTRVYADSDSRMRWNADDRISVFNENTFNQQFRFLGNEGDRSGDFELVPPADTLLAVDSVFAVYPYQEETSIDQDGRITLSLPAVQTYKEDSFGPGANTMIAMTSGNHLKFKNAGGFLTFKLYGSNVGVASVVLKGRNNELLAGKCTAEVVDGLPVLTMDADEATKEVKVYCDSSVVLGTTSANATEFWFVLPPVTFTGGFTITVNTDDGRTFSKSTTKSKAITRNTILRMDPIQVKPSGQTTLSITSVSTVIGKTDNNLSSTTLSDKTYTADYNETTKTFTLTLPTVTDFSGLVLNCTYRGNQLKADGKVIESGVTPVDASAFSADESKPSSKDVVLAACNGDVEMRYTLVVRNTGLPVVRITTSGFVQKDIENDTEHETWRPTKEESNGGIASASIRIDKANGKKDCDVVTQIKGRGNASWRYKKRPFALKLDKSTKVLGMKKSKRWVLLANWKDRTLLRNDAAFWLSRQCEFPFYTVSGQFVELEFNGIHRGNYYLCEQVKVEENRVNIQKLADSTALARTGGYLMEIDNAYDENFKFISDKFKLKYMFKDPDSLSTDAYNYMKGFINNVENLIWEIPDHRNDASYTYPYRDYFDMDSAIWFMFINELTGNGDFFNTDAKQYYGPHSTNLYKDRDSTDNKVSKLHMGPVWDFDYLTFYDKAGSPSRSNKWVGAKAGYYYFNFLYLDPVFKARMLELWDQHKAAFAQLPAYINDMADYIYLSEEINTAMWGYSGTDQNQNGDNALNFYPAIAKMISAFTTKWSFMDGDIANLTYSNPGNFPYSQWP